MSTPTPPRPRGTALVVGGTSAIGQAVGAALAARGLALHLWGRDAERLGRAAAALAARGAAVSTHAVDVRDRAALAAAAEACPRPLEVLVYAAGAFDWADAVDADPAVWEEVLDVTAVAAVQTARALLPALVEAAPSTLVLVGSGAAVTPYPHNAAYVASKHALAGFAGSVGAEVRHLGVRVCTVNPGMVAAGASLASPVGRAAPERLLQPDDVARAVAFAVDAPPGTWVPRIDLQPLADPSA